MTSRRWYAVSTQPQRESFASEQLERQGYEVFFPRQLKTVRHARRTLQRFVGYFPGYVFVRLDPARDRWRSINGTFGVRSLVMAGEQPAAAPQGLVDELMEACDEAGVMAPLGDWKEGERVRLLNGPFADALGVIDRLEGRARVRVLMDMIGGVRPVLTDSYNLALAS